MDKAMKNECTELLHDLLNLSHDVAMKTDVSVDDVPMRRAADMIERLMTDNDEMLKTLKRVYEYYKYENDIHILEMICDVIDKVEGKEPCHYV